MLHMNMGRYVNVPFYVGMQCLKLRVSPTNEDRGRSETVVDNKVLRTTVEKKLGNSVRNFAKKLGVPPATILHHLKFIGNDKQNG